MNELITQAKEILRNNDRGGFTVPTAGLYPFQWMWDSGFTALGWAKFDEKRAWQEFELLFRGQWPNGMLPHIVFHTPESTYFPGPDRWGTLSTHNPPTSAVTQPPVVASFVHEMLEHATDKAAAEANAKALYPKLLSYHRWFKRERDPENTGLIRTFHPWETGADNSPAWDEALGRVQPDPNLPPYTRRDTSHVDPSQRPHQTEYDRYLTLLEIYKQVGFDQLKLYKTCPFRVADLIVNCILHRANRDLIRLAERFSPEDIPEIKAWLEASAPAIENLWDEAAGLYFNYDFIANRPIKIGVSASFLPLYAGTASQARADRLAQTLQSWGQKVAFLVPSTDPSSDKFEPQRYWRGPVWAIMNRIIAKGFSEYGHAELAQRIRQNTHGLFQRSGFSEYYHPQTGAGLGGKAFSWTAAMLLAWE